MDKRALLAQVVAGLETELEKLRAATRAAAEAATGEESKPENQYDTRALEASYLAGAQEARVRELAAMILTLREFPLSTGPSIATGSLVETDSDGARAWFFLLPYGAGVSLEAAGQKVAVVTVESPLGQALRGKEAGDVANLPRREYEILSVR